MAETQSAAVLVGRVVPIKQTTVTSLLEAVRDCFDGDSTVLSILYNRNLQHLQVMRMEPPDKESGDVENAFAYLKQTGDFDLMDVGLKEFPRALLKASEALNQRGAAPRYLLCRSIRQLSSDLGFNPAVALAVQSADVTLPFRGVVLAASKRSSLLEDIELAVVIRLEKETS